MAETISDTKLRLETFVLENFPEADIAPGTVLSELVMKLAATLQNPVKNDMLELNQANTIAKVLASEEDTYDPIMDGIASNYNTSRSAGKKSVGKIKVIVTDDQTRFITAGFSFYQPVLKLNYLTAIAYRVTTDPTEVTDLGIFAEGSLFYFIVPVEAENVGNEYQLSASSKFSLTIEDSITGFVEGSAYGNFTSGLPVDTDKQLIAKLQTGLTHKTLLTPSSILSRVQDLYPNVRDLSIVGVNDPEMTRSKRNLFGLSTLGMADVYVRSTLGPETVQITKTATQSDGVWMFTLGQDDYPGFYRIVSILPAGKGLTGTLVNTQGYSFSTAGIFPSNVVGTAIEARFSKYQNSVVTFEYESTETEMDFDLILSYQPNIGDIQDLLLSSDERIACADYLVKAAIPCFVSVHMRLHRANPNVDLPVDKIKQDIYNYINTIPFGSNLYVSKLIDICHNYDVRYVEFPVRVTGTVYAADSRLITVSSTDTLSIPIDLAVGVSPKTTLFFADYFSSSIADLQNSMSDSIGIDVI